MAGKPLPDFSGTDENEVRLVLQGQIQDTQFLKFLEKVGQEQLQAFSLHDLMVLDLIHREQIIPEYLKRSLQGLLELKIIERIRKNKLILSKRFYEFIDKRGEYTRRKGLNRPAYKQLILQHIKDNHGNGSPMRDLMEVVPQCSRMEVKRLLTELRDEEKIHLRGKLRNALWYSGTQNN